MAETASNISELQAPDSSGPSSSIDSGKRRRTEEGDDVLDLDEYIQRATVAEEKLAQVLRRLDEVLAAKDRETTRANNAEAKLAQETVRANDAEAKAAEQNSRAEAYGDMWNNLLTEHGQLKTKAAALEARARSAENFLTDAREEAFQAREEAAEARAAASRAGHRFMPDPTPRQQELLYHDARMHNQRSANALFGSAVSHAVDGLSGYVWRP